MSELLCINIKTFNDGGFQLYQNGLFHKLLETIDMEHCNGFPTPANNKASFVAYKNVTEDKIDFSNLLKSIIRTVLYLESNTRRYLYFDDNFCV